MNVESSVMLPAEELQPLLALLTSFWREMKDWELYCCGLQERELAGEISTDELKAQVLPRAASIFDRHCDLKKEPDRIRGGRYNFGSPPQYDPDLDTLVSVEKTKSGYTVQVRKGSNLGGNLFTYTVINISGVLKLKDHRVLDAQGRRITAGL